MEKVLKIPHRDLANLAQLYEGELTENALLNKEAHLAAKKHVLLKTKTKMPSPIVNAKVKLLSRELHHLV